MAVAEKDWGLDSQAINNSNPWEFDRMIWCKGKILKYMYLQLNLTNQNEDWMPVQEYLSQNNNAGVGM